MWVFQEIKWNLDCICGFYTQFVQGSVSPVFSVGRWIPLYLSLPFLWYQSSKFPTYISVMRCCFQQRYTLHYGKATPNITQDFYLALCSGSIIEDSEHHMECQIVKLGLPYANRCPTSFSISLALVLAFKDVLLYSNLWCSHLLIVVF